MAVILHPLSPPFPFLRLWSILTAARLGHPAAIHTPPPSLSDGMSRRPWRRIQCPHHDLQGPAWPQPRSSAAFCTPPILPQPPRTYESLPASGTVPAALLPGTVSQVFSCLSPPFLPVCAETSLQRGRGSLGHAAPLYFSSECLWLVSMFAFTAALPELELCMASGGCSANICRAGKRMKELVERAEWLQQRELG